MVDLRTYQKMHQQQHLRLSAPQDIDHTLDQEEMDADEPPEGNFIFLLPRTVSGFNMQAKQWGKCRHLTKLAIV
jgi:hypothetical protein